VENQADSSQVKFRWLRLGKVEFPEGIQNFRKLEFSGKTANLPEKFKQQKVNRKFFQITGN
jgi:hypothetical protein